jgi:hypothetical protein
MADYPLLGSYNRYPELNFDGEDTVNLFLIRDPKGKKRQALLSTPGLRLRQEIQAGGTSPSRALFVFENNMYGVFGSSVYLFDVSLVPVLIGALTTNQGYVSITNNNANQIIFIDGQGGYIYNTNTGVFSKITSPDFPPLPLNVAYLDTYFAIPSGTISAISIECQ